MLLIVAEAGSKGEELLDYICDMPGTKTAKTKSRLGLIYQEDEGMMRVMMRKGPSYSFLLQVGNENKLGVGKNDVLVLREIAGNHTKLKPKSLDKENWQYVEVGRSTSQKHFLRICNELISYAARFCQNEEVSECYTVESGYNYFLDMGLDISSCTLSKLTELAGKDICKGIHPGSIRFISDLALFLGGYFIFCHEYSSNVRKDQNIHLVGGMHITRVSVDSKIWGIWVPIRFRNLGDKELNYRLKHSRNAIAFHLNASKYVSNKLGLNFRSASGYIYENDPNLKRTIKILLERDWQRFYRLYDENGIAYTLSPSKSTSDFFYYENHENNQIFPREDVVSNVLKTFEYMHTVESDDPGASYPNKLTVVPDINYWLSLMNVLHFKKTGKKYQHQFSGTEMFKYMYANPAQAHMTLERNRRLIDLIISNYCHRWGVDDCLTEIIYKPLNTELFVRGHKLKQLYTIDESWRWLKAVLPKKLRWKKSYIRTDMDQYAFYRWFRDGVLDLKETQKNVGQLYVDWEGEY